jgi:hypothetical protein
MSGRFLACAGVLTVLLSQALSVAGRQGPAANQDYRELYARLKAGRSYGGGGIGDLSRPPLVFAPVGAVSRARQNARGLWHPYLYVVPESYDPRRRYPVRFYLQGDTTRPASSAESGVRWLNYDTLAREDAIVVFPGAWNGFPWWGLTQVEHMTAVLDELKRTYNIDENRVYLIGSSDGGTGVYYHALVATTPWAAFLPFNADPSVLAYPPAGVDAELFAVNLAAKPVLAIHGGRDQINPVAAVQAWLGLFERAGSSLTLRLKEDYGHETRWWAEETAVMDGFMASHPRDPLPDAITWETADTVRFNRAHWVVIDELGRAAGELAPDTPNEVATSATALGVGICLDVAGGVELRLIQPGSLADTYGLREGDVIDQVNETPTPTFRQLQEAFQAHVGSVVQIRVTRNGLRRVQPLNLPARPGTSPVAAFPRHLPSGRIDVVRRGNTVDAQTRGVRRFTLLLSEDEFDFSKPITVRTNGTTVFEAIMTPSADVLQKWATRDNDRTMLFAQELTITLPEQ